MLTARPYTSVSRCSQRVGRSATSVANRSAAYWPHAQAVPPRVQFCASSGASIPNRRTEIPRIDSVSPSDARARPLISCAAKSAGCSARIATIVTCNIRRATIAAKSQGPQAAAQPICRRQTARRNGPRTLLVRADVPPDYLIVHGSSFIAMFLSNDAIRAGAASRYMAIWIRT